MRQEVRVDPEKMIKEAEDSVDDLHLVTDSPGLYPFGHLEVTHRQVQPARLQSEVKYRRVGRKFSTAEYRIQYRIKRRAEQHSKSTPQ